MTVKLCSTKHQTISRLPVENGSKRELSIWTYCDKNKILRRQQMQAKLNFGVESRNEASF